MNYKRAPFTHKESVAQLKRLPAWGLSKKRKSIRRVFVLKEIGEAVKLIRKISILAEKENHHPDIHLTKTGKLVVELSTHSLNGLSLKDFALAAKIEKGVRS